MRGWTADKLPKGARVFETSAPQLPACFIEPNVKRGIREIVVQREIVAMLVRAGCTVTVTDAAMAFGHDGRPRKKVQTGWPDVTGCGPLGRFIAFETKAGRNGLREAQTRILGQLWGNGGIVAVPRTVRFAAQVLHEAYAFDGGKGNRAVDRLLYVARAYLES